jgi:hypothetical protein
MQTRSLDHEIEEFTARLLAGQPEWIEREAQLRFGKAGVLTV